MSIPPQLRSPELLQDKSRAYRAWLWDRIVAFSQSQTLSLAELERVQVERNEALGLAPPVVTVHTSRAMARLEESRSDARQRTQDQRRMGLATAEDQARALNESMRARAAVENADARLDTAAGRLLRTGALECIERHSARGLLPCLHAERYGTVR